MPKIIPKIRVLIRKDLIDRILERKDLITGSSRNRKKHVIKISNLPNDITTKELFDLVHVWGEIGNINIKTYYDSVGLYIDFYNQNETLFY